MTSMNQNPFNFFMIIQIPFRICIIFLLPVTMTMVNKHCWINSKGADYSKNVYRGGGHIGWRYIANFPMKAIELIYWRFSTPFKEICFGEIFRFVKNIASISSWLFLSNNISSRSLRHPPMFPWHIFHINHKQELTGSIECTKH